MARKGQSFKLAPPSPKREVEYRIWRALRSQQRTASRQRTLVDLLERFRATPNRAFFLYDGFSAEIGEWVERYLPELNDRSGEYLDIYDYTITNHKAEGVHAASRNIASRLSPIPNSSWDEIYSAGLPSILIWSDRASGILPIGPLASNPRKMQKFFDMLITCVKGGPINAWHFDELETYINEHSEIEKVLDEQRKAATPCDVFVSYRRSDRAYVEVLADILTQAGLRPWFDKFIPFGQQFASTILAQIIAAPAVLLLWSKDSATSPWVLREMEEALRQNKLVPTCLNSAPHHQSFSRLNISYLDGDDFNEKSPKILDILQGLASKARKAVATIINRHSELNEIKNIRELAQTSTYHDLDKLKYLRIKLKSWIKINSTSEHYTLAQDVINLLEAKIRRETSP